MWKWGQGHVLMFAAIADGQLPDSSSHDHEFVCKHAILKDLYLSARRIISNKLQLKSHTKNKLIIEYMKYTFETDRSLLSAREVLFSFSINSYNLIEVLLFGRSRWKK